MRRTVMLIAVVAAVVVGFYAYRVIASGGGPARESFRSTPSLRAASTPARLATTTIHNKGQQRHR